MSIKRATIIKSVLVGWLGILALATLYFILLTWVGHDWRHPFQQFLTVKYWMSALFLGFGLQLALFWYTKLMIKIKQAQRVAVANTGVSAATMIACCAHHLFEVVPILGLSAVSIFLARYQVYILGLAVMANGLGVYYMARMIKQHKLHQINI